MKDRAGRNPPNTAVLSLAQLLADQPAAPPPGWIEPGLLPAQGILFVGGEPKVGKSLLVANLALALAAGQNRVGFTVPVSRRVLICQFELPLPPFVSRLTLMRRTLGPAADDHLFVDVLADGRLEERALRSDPDVHLSVVTDVDGADRLQQRGHRAPLDVVAHRVREDLAQRVPVMIVKVL